MDEKLVQVFADSSFGPASGRSHQGLIVQWAGVPINWESSRQSLVSLSTAESELIAVVSGAQMGHAMASLISEILGIDPDVRPIVRGQPSVHFHCVGAPRVMAK